MANVPVVNQGKTKFVKEYLAEHGDAKRAAINEAWRAAGHKDEISESLVYKMRSRHGLTAQQSDVEDDVQKVTTSTVEVKKAKSKNKVESVSAEEQPVEGTEDQSNDKAPGKAAFVEGVLRRDPKATVKVVNQAWLEAGYEGTISDPTFYKVRSQLVAVQEPIGPTSTKTPTTSGVNSKTAQTSTTTTAADRSSVADNPGQVSDEVEAGIDDLMYKLKDRGGMPEVEAALRAARRLLYRSQGE